MITLTSHRQIDESMYYDKYSSDYYDIVITVIDNKLESITVSNKSNSGLLPNINVFLCDDNQSLLDVTMLYSRIEINSTQRAIFEKYYETTKIFIDTELKPFIQNELNKHKIRNL